MEWNELFKEDKNIWKEPAPILVKRSNFWKNAGVEKIADIGCGSGRNSIYLAGEGFFIYAHDTSEVALEKLMEIRRSTTISKESIEIGLIKNNIINIDSNSCDVVVCISSIHHNYKKGLNKSLKEINRILKDNGELFIVVPSDKHPTYRSGLEVEDNTFITDSGIDPGIPHHFFTRGSLNKIIENNHFKIAYTHEINSSDIAGINNGHLLAIANKLI